jgi:isopentenyldiphosphate isomerase
MTTLKQRLTNLQLVQLVDKWPYFMHDPAAYRAHMQNFYYFRVAGYEHPLAYVFRPYVEKFPWDAAPSCWAVDHARRTVTLTTPRDADPSTRTATIDAALRAAVAADSPIKAMRKWHDEAVPVYYVPTPSGQREHVMDIDRCGANLFSFPGYGVHMTGYTTTPSGEIHRIWVPRRSFTKSTYPGMLDNTVGGTLRAGETPLECIIRESCEELCIPEEYTRARILPCGMLACHLWRAEHDPSAPAYERQVQYIYELEMDADIVPRIGDGEVAEVALMSVDEIRDRLVQGEFKHNTALTYLAFFIRHGIITAENEPDFEEIVNRMHRSYDMFEV